MKNLIVTFFTSFVVTFFILQSGLFTQAQESAPVEELQEIGLFPDAEPDAWFTPYIEELVESGIATGKPDGTFGSWEPVNKAELAKMLVLLRSELRGNWLKDNLLEIVLVIATVYGWMSIISRIPISQPAPRPTRKNSTAQSTRKSPHNVRPTPAPKTARTAKKGTNHMVKDPFVLPELKEGVPPPEILKDKRTTSTIEKNLKSNWWS